LRLKEREAGIPAAGAGAIVATPISDDWGLARNRADRICLWAIDA
jgi:hypothetical protein